MPLQFWRAIIRESYMYRLGAALFHGGSGGSWWLMVFSLAIATGKVTGRLPKHR
jgi:hypothetical protein